MLSHKKKWFLGGYSLASFFKSSEVNKAERRRIAIFRDTNCDDESCREQKILTKRLTWDEQSSAGPYLYEIKNILFYGEAELKNKKVNLKRKTQASMHNCLAQNEVSGLKVVSKSMSSMWGNNTGCSPAMKP